MPTHADKSQKSQRQSVAGAVPQKQTDFQFVDNRPDAAAQRKRQETANNSTKVLQTKSFQEMADKSPQNQQFTQFRKMTNVNSSKEQQPIQKKENNTGLPDDLKSGIENLSGYAMDDVKVHYNSDKPAQL
ncbi:MAG: hypothetical protein WBA74_09925, partial [Cyclobacteriaceae bacterium]